MINCLLTVTQCTLITNHSAAENGIFQQNDLHQSSSIFLMEEKWIPKKLEKAKDNYGIPSGGNCGVPGGPGRTQELAKLGWRRGSRAPGCAAPGQQRGSAAPAGLGLQGLGGKEKQKPCAVASHLTGCKTQDKLWHFHFLYINLWFSQGTALH